MSSCELFDAMYPKGPQLFVPNGDMYPKELIGIFASGVECVCMGQYWIVYRCVPVELDIHVYWSKICQLL